MQSESLDQLSESVSTLHRMGHEIKNELDEQNALLNDVEIGMDENLHGLSIISKQTNALVKKAGGKKWCALITALSIIAIFLLYLIIIL